MDTSTWDTIDRLVAWLDEASVLPRQTEQLLRVMKLQEEVGEAAQALTGVLGQNPRKGVAATWGDVHSELCDVIVAAMVALRTLTPEAEKVFAERVAHVAERSLAPVGGETVSW